MTYKRVVGGLLLVLVFCWFGCNRTVHYSPKEGKILGGKLTVFAASGAATRTLDLSEGGSASLAEGEAISLDGDRYTAKPGGATVRLVSGQLEITNVRRGQR